MTRLRLLRVAAGAILAIAALWMTAAAAAVADAPRNVLVLFSNSRLAQGNTEVDRGLRAALTDTTPPVHLFFEFLDSPEFGGEAHDRTVIAYLRAKYASRPPEALLAFSDAAYRFVVQHREDLFPAVPLVYASVAPDVLVRMPAPPDAVGVTVEYDFSGTIAQALHWHPDARQLIVITGVSSRDRGWEARLRKEAPALAGDRRVEFWAGLPTATLLQRLAALDASSVVFTPGYYIDGAGALSNPRDSVARLAPASSAPVYGQLGTFIGTGAVGGRMVNFEGIGRQAGQLVAQLLAGAPAAAHENVIRAPITLHVDWRQVERFGIDEAAIPADAVVHFREPTFWQQYRRVAIGAAAIIALQAALIGTLLFERRRRRAAEVVAQKQRLELAHASRLAVAGELTASIAHEINQPLAAVQTSADAADMLLRSNATGREDLLRIVTRIHRDSVRAADVIRRLRTLLARHAPERRPFDLAAAVGDTVELMSAEARRRGVALGLKAAAPSCRVAGDRTQIQQVLINLMLNAMDAVADVPPDRRVATISVEALDKRIRLTVRDQGNGFAADDPEKAFDSFYSTKAQGMGLGLSIARTIIEAHGGRIWAASQSGQGAALSFELPATLDEVDSAARVA